MAEGFIQDWQKFLAENYFWFLPMVATLVAPLLGAGANALYDYFKMKRWIK